jgi:Lhr-like helicase
VKQSAISAIEELVRSVANSTARGKVKLGEKMEALRVLAPYYAALKKTRAIASDEEKDEITIGNLQNAVRNLEDGNGGTVPDHRGRASEEGFED